MANAERLRPVASFSQRVVTQFLAPENLDYLRRRLADAHVDELRPDVADALGAAARDFARRAAPDVLGADASARRRGDFWAEVRRLNRAFYDDRIAAAQAPVSRESYHMAMFEADSLRPPGLAHLNGPGPIHAVSQGYPAADYNPLDADLFDDYNPLDAEDAAWSRADGTRSAATAVAEYWGDGWAASDTPLGAAEAAVGGRAYATSGDEPTWGDVWGGGSTVAGSARDRGVGRFMRREAPPFWQRGGRTGYDVDVDETLGLAPVELGGQVRGWDMSRLY